MVMLKMHLKYKYFFYNLLKKFRTKEFFFIYFVLVSYQFILSIHFNVLKSKPTIWQSFQAYTGFRKTANISRLITRHHVWNRYKNVVYTFCFCFHKCRDFRFFKVHVALKTIIVPIGTCVQINVSMP